MVTPKRFFRLLRRNGPSALIGAIAGAARESVRSSRITVAKSMNGEWTCRLRKTWRFPRWPHLKRRLDVRLGGPSTDFRRRCETSPPDIYTPAQEPPTAYRLLLAGPSALADNRVMRFLGSRAAAGDLNLLHGDDVADWAPGLTNVLYGIDADLAGHALLTGLRQRGVHCDWLAALPEVPAAEVPLRDACDRQASPSAATDSLQYSDIVLPPPTFRSNPITDPAKRTLRILTYRWHVPHQYELFKLGADFTLVTDLGESSCRWWDLGQRPMPANARFAEWKDIEQSDFDLAILHFDEHVLDQLGKDTAIGADWGRTFRFLKHHLKIPCVAVCHGTPQAADSMLGDDGSEANRLELIELLADIPVVVNSHQALSEWDFNRARVIWQGFDPAEFPSRPPTGDVRPRILTLPPSAYALRPAYHGTELLRSVRQALPELAFENLAVPEPNLLLRGNAYAHAKFRHYVRAIHQFNVYFNPTLHSPMPRTRGEAMLCGLATVNARNHDVDLFINNGRDGFYGTTADELADQLQFLSARPDRTWKIGQAARETMIRVFHIDRFLSDWRELIRDVLGNSVI